MVNATLLIQIVTGALIAAIAYWMKRIDSKMDNLVNKDDCKERRETICTKLKAAEDIRKSDSVEVWDRINHHGHVGLAGDGAKVTTG